MRKVTKKHRTSARSAQKSAGLTEDKEGRLIIRVKSKDRGPKPKKGKRKKS